MVGLGGQEILILGVLGLGFVVVAFVIVKAIAKTEK
jgi:hypothetical protein